MKPSTLTIHRKLRGVTSHHLGKSACSSCIYHACGCKLSVRWLVSFRSVMRVVVLVLRPPGLSVFVLNGLHVPVHTNSTGSIVSEIYRAAVLDGLLARCNDDSIFWGCQPLNNVPCHPVMFIMFSRVRHFPPQLATFLESSRSPTAHHGIRGDKRG